MGEIISAQIFNLRLIIEKMLAKGKMYAVFVDLDKAYDMANWEAIWDVLKVHKGGWKGTRWRKSFS